ncbi:MAG TPA: MOSC N-terminal beta barrel domain-containing protein [Acidimicrobiia bacterium]|nr:MOSC N-terminal beta barrel domain-containing protein [Acidimicrobiia bacterium]
MRVAELWRFPVKSLQGEQLGSATVTAAGIVGDRAFAIFDVATGLGLTARRIPELLDASARVVDDGAPPEITLPDGSIARDDAALSDWLGRRVTLCAAADVVDRRYENPLDAEREADWIVFEGAPGPFHDSARTRVSLVSTGTLGDWDRRRFRANVVLDGDGEDAFVGTTITVGEVALDVVKRIGRCVMITRPQPGAIERDLDVLKRVNHDHDGCLGIGALVARSGAIGAGDVLRPRD